MKHYRYALGLLLCWVLSATAADRGVLFEVSSDTGKAWLLGSLHVGKPEFYPLSPAIERAFAQSDQLVVEVDMDRVEPRVLQHWLQRHATFPPGQSLRDTLSPDTAAALDQACQQYTLPCDQLMQQRAGLFTLSVASLRMAQLGYQPQWGIDQHFVTQAHGSKPILELEHWRDQMSLLLAFHEDELILRQLIDQLEAVDAFLNQTEQAWRSGDLAALERLLITDELDSYPQLAPLYRRLFDDRNRAMAERISAMMSTGKTSFVVVGAGHLVGAQGIPALLTAWGYDVEQH